ncbi:hypothetical protein DFS34DRAFT_609959 [Phlyctochytrium arcticum]|nr:hypothetical protein DFS34DRAFT_640667 [Phlyctochytrium arcticum]KAI9102630.1 hypothetical protein DFS34DRAFT_609959 [Phlyctochytrium arcticum]
MSDTNTAARPGETVTTAGSTSGVFRTEKDGKVEYTCSMWTAFDKVQLCYTAIPQAKYYYRYGKLRDCSQIRSDFAFCFAMKTKSKAEANRLIAHREEELYDRKVEDRPSKAVWELRSQPPPNFPPTI